MNKSELKQLIREAIDEAKYGTKSSFIKFTQDYDSGMRLFKKGEIIPVYINPGTGEPEVLAGNELTLTFPKDTYKLITRQSQLPDDLAKRFTVVKRALGVLIKNRKQYYDDVLTDDFVNKFVSDVEGLLNTLKNTKGAKRK
jgi:hypothetical protein